MKLDLELQELEKKGKGRTREASLLRCRLARPMVGREVRVGEKNDKGEPLLGAIIVSGPNVFGDPEGEAYLNRRVDEVKNLLFLFLFLFLFFFKIILF